MYWDPLSYLNIAELYLAAPHLWDTLLLLVLFLGVSEYVFTKQNSYFGKSHGKKIAIAVSLALTLSTSTFLYTNGYTLAYPGLNIIAVVIIFSIFFLLLYNIFTDMMDMERMCAASLAFIITYPGVRALFLGPNQPIAQNQPLLILFINILILVAVIALVVCIVRQLRGDPDEQDNQQPNNQTTNTTQSNPIFPQNELTITIQEPSQAGYAPTVQAVPIQMQITGGDEPYQWVLFLDDQPITQGTSRSIQEQIPPPEPGRHQLRLDVNDSSNQSESQTRNFVILPDDSSHNNNSNEEEQEESESEPQSESEEPLEVTINQPAQQTYESTVSYIPLDVEITGGSGSYIWELSIDDASTQGRSSHIQQRLRVPAVGEHTIRVTVQDIDSGETAQATQEFEVVSGQGSQNTGDNTSNSDEETVTVNGRAIYADTQEPVQEGVVQLFTPNPPHRRIREEWARTRIGAGGAFVLEHIPRTQAGYLPVATTKNGEQGQMIRPGRVLIVDPSQSPPVPELILIEVSRRKDSEQEDDSSTDTESEYTQEDTSTKTTKTSPTDFVLVPKALQASDGPAQSTKLKDNTPYVYREVRDDLSHITSLGYHARHKGGKGRHMMRFYLTVQTPDGSRLDQSTLEKLGLHLGVRKGFAKLIRSWNGRLAFETKLSSKSSDVDIHLNFGDDKNAGSIFKQLGLAEHSKLQFILTGVVGVHNDNDRFVPARDENNNKIGAHAAWIVEYTTENN